MECPLTFDLSGIGLDDTSALLKHLSQMLTGLQVIQGDVTASLLVTLPNHVLGKALPSAAVCLRYAVQVYGCTLFDESAL